MMIILVATLMDSEKPLVRRMTGNEISAEISFFFILPLDKCGPVWYNNSGDQRAGVGRPGPNFRSVYPIWKIFATSSDFSYALNFPVKPGPPEGRPGILTRASIASAYGLSYKVKWPVGGIRTDRLIIILFHYNYNIFFNICQADRENKKKYVFLIL